jgi:hypothetical protein
VSAGKAARLALALVMGLPLTAILGVVVGAVLAYGFGAAGLRDLIILAIGGATSSFAAHRMFAAGSRPLIPAFGIQGAHAALLLTSVLAHNQWGGLFDVFALVGPMIWVSVRPERLPATVLLGSHAVQSVLLIWQWASAIAPGVLLPLLVSHLSLRLAGSLLTVRGLQTISKRARVKRGSRRDAGAPRP